MKEYPIDEEFWKWWFNYWAQQDVDILDNFCYNCNREKEKETSQNGTVEIHECPPQ